jgi:hypothetical protein
MASLQSQARDVPRNFTGMRRQGIAGRPLLEYPLLHKPALLVSSVASNLWCATRSGKDIYLVIDSPRLHSGVVRSVQRGQQAELMIVTW